MCSPSGSTPAPAVSSLFFGLMALAAGVGEGAVGEYGLLVAAVAGALEDLEGEVELAGAVGIVDVADLPRCQTRTEFTGIAAV